MAVEETLAATGIGHFRHQYYAVFVATIIAFSNGLLIAWLTPILPLLKSDDTPLASGPVSLQEVSWLGSLVSIGGMVGALVLRPLTSRVGCKRMMMFLAIPSVVTWLLIISASSTYPILATRFLCGVIGAGIDSGTILFVAEISDDRIRGALSSAPILARSIGYMTAFAVGAYVEYAIVPFLYIGTPILFLVLFLCLPNTAPFLIQHGNYEGAKKAIKFYKGYTEDSAEHTCALNWEFERLLAHVTQQTKQSSISFRAICQPIVCKALFIAIILTLLNQYSGCYTMTLYSVVLFQQSGTHIDPHVSSIIMGALQVIGTLSSTSLVDCIGRKWLLIISMAGCAAGLSAMSIYMYLKSLGFALYILHWVPVASIGLVILISSVGIVPLLFVCIVEMLPTEARGIGITISVVSVNVFAFISSKTFPILSESMQLHGCIAIYAIICALGTIFVAVVINETKGKNLDVIGKKNENTSAKSTA